MIRVTVEMLRHGNPRDVTRLTIIEIVNDATGTENIANYDVCDYASGIATRLEGFDRINARYADLVAVAVSKLVSDNPRPKSE